MVLPDKRATHHFKIFQLINVIRYLIVLLRGGAYVFHNFIMIVLAPEA